MVPSPLEPGQALSPKSGSKAGGSADLVLSLGQGCAGCCQGEGVMLRSGRVHRSLHFSASAAAGISRSWLGQGRARPPWPRLPGMGRLAASTTLQQLHSLGHPVSMLRATEKRWLWAPVGVRANKQDIYTPGVTPREPGSGRRLGTKSGLETLSSQGWGGGIKLCSDTQILQNRENGGRAETPKPWRAWGQTQGGCKPSSSH